METFQVGVVGHETSTPQARMLIDGLEVKGKQILGRHDEVGSGSLPTWDLFPEECGKRMSGGVRAESLAPRALFLQQDEKQGSN